MHIASMPTNTTSMIATQTRVAPRRTAGRVVRELVAFDLIVLFLPIRRPVRAGPEIMRVVRRSVPPACDGRADRKKKDPHASRRTGPWPEVSVRVASRPPSPIRVCRPRGRPAAPTAHLHISIPQKHPSAGGRTLKHGSARMSNKKLLLLLSPPVVDFPRFPGEFEPILVRVRSRDRVKSKFAQLSFFC